MSCHYSWHEYTKRGIEWHNLQAAGIERAKQQGKYKGKPKMEINWSLFKELYPIWQRKEITAIDMMNKLGLKPNTFYRRVKEYREQLIDK